ncbi:hypothetical protein NLI96_g13191 [Meripilus lineatus]|uniref:Uncharacterized protein n=1 Tax=Meripilus lineatus TaxID=2056292 RepID=A0AAD5UNG9_9APHY|nr:hypothetical protein NLI96_g13191 [Physisporinus lineatus]
MKAIYELSFKTILRNMPMILVGGLSAWKRDLGEIELVREGVVVGGGAGTGVAISLGLGVEGAGYYAPSPKLNGGLGINGSPAMNMNGITPSAGYINGSTTPSSSSSSSASASTTQPAARTNGAALGLGGITNGHSRTPAESSTSSALFSPGLAESYVRGTASARPGGSFGIAGSSGVVDGGVGVGAGVSSPPPPATYQQWIPPAGALASMDNLPLTSPRIGGDVSTPLSPPVVDLAKRPLVRKPAISRPVSNSVSENNATASHRSSPSLASTGFTPISYPQFSQYPTSSTTSSSSSTPTSPPSFTTHSQTPKISPQAHRLVLLPLTTFEWSRLASTTSSSD